MTFYNTIHETGEELAESHAKAKTQEEKIYAYFLYCNQPLSPSMFLEQLGLNCPITSVRRAICNLTKEGKIFKTKETVLGMYGKKETLWMLSGPDQQLSLLQIVNTHTH